MNEPSDFETIDMGAVVAHLHHLGIHAVIEQTGGGTATIFVGPLRDDPVLGPRYAIAAGPGWFNGPGWTNAMAALGEFCFGPDDLGQAQPTFPQTADPVAIAHAIADRLRAPAPRSTSIPPVVASRRPESLWVS